MVPAFVFQTIWLKTFPTWAIYFLWRLHQFVRSGRRSSEVPSCVYWNEVEIEEGETSRLYFSTSNHLTDVCVKLAIEYLIMLHLPPRSIPRRLLKLEISRRAMFVCPMSELSVGRLDSDIPVVVFLFIRFSFQTHACSAGVVGDV